MTELQGLQTLHMTNTYMHRLPGWYLEELVMKAPQLRSLSMEKRHLVRLQEHVMARLNKLEHFDATDATDVPDPHEHLEIYEEEEARIKAEAKARAREAAALKQAQLEQRREERVRQQRKKA